MSDGERTFEITLTEAQYDVLQSAIDTAFAEWGYRERVRDKQTLLRCASRLQIGWSKGLRR